MNPPTPKPRPKPRRKWIRRTSALLIAIGLIVPAAYFLLLPIYVKARIHAALRDAGLADATFTLQRVSLSRIDINTMRIGNPPWVAINALHVELTLASLWRGQVDSVDISGLQWNATIGSSGIDLGYRPPPREPYAEPIRDLPLNLLTIRDSQLRLQWNGQPHVFDASGSMIRLATGKFDINTGLGPIKATGGIDVSGPSLSAMLLASLPPTAIGALPLLRDAVPQLRDVEFGGTCAVDATIQLANGTLQPLIRITATHVSASQSDWPAMIGDASAVIEINGLSPLTTPQHQELSVAKARIGPIDITDGKLAFAIQSPNSIAIEKAQWSMGEYGRFNAAPFEFNPRDVNIETELSCDDVGLGQWLSLLTSKKAEGGGTLEGTAKLIFRPSQSRSIVIERGDLHASSNAGWIRTGDRNMLAGLLEASAKTDMPMARWNEIKDRIVRALEDFEYSVFEIQMEPEDDDVLCRIITAGKGRQGLDPQEIGSLVVNIHHFGDLLNRVLLVKSAFDRME